MSGRARSGRTSAGERIHHLDASRGEVGDVAGDDDQAALERDRGDLKIGACMSEFRRKPSPEPRRRGREGQKPVGEEVERRREPDVEIAREGRIPPLLKGYAAREFTNGNRADVELLLATRAEPGDNLRMALRTTERRDDVCVEQIAQNATSRGRASARGSTSSSAPTCGIARRWSMKRGRAAPQSRS